MHLLTPILFFVVSLRVRFYLLVSLNSMTFIRSLRDTDVLLNVLTFILLSSSLRPLFVLFFLLLVLPFQLVHIISFLSDEIFKVLLKSAFQCQCADARRKLLREQVTQRMMIMFEVTSRELTRKKEKSDDYITLGDTFQVVIIVTQ